MSLIWSIYLGFRNIILCIIMQFSCMIFKMKKKIVCVWKWLNNWAWIMWKRVTAEYILNAMPKNWSKSFCLLNFRFNLLQGLICLLALSSRPPWIVYDLTDLENNSFLEWWMIEIASQQPFSKCGDLRWIEFWVQSMNGILTHILGRVMKLATNYNMK